VKTKIQKTVVILHDIRSNANVGSIFRTADTAGVSKIYLTGYTPAPLDRFGRPVKEIAKIALGAEKNIPWVKVKNVSKAIDDLRKEKFKIIAVEQAGNSVDYKKINKSGRMAFIFGNEVKGLSPKVISLADVVAEIPMLGKKESLNVSVSAGIALFRILNI
jgi:tRNA G18 (ribose-2'-O)-methylase SpoU